MRARYDGISANPFMFDESAGLNSFINGHKVDIIKHRRLAEAYADMGPNIEHQIKKHLHLMIDAMFEDEWSYKVRYPLKITRSDFIEFGRALDQASPATPPIYLTGFDPYPNSYHFIPLIKS